MNNWKVEEIQKRLDAGRVKATWNPDETYNSVSVTQFSCQTSMVPMFSNAAMDLDYLLRLAEKGERLARVIEHALDLKHMGDGSTKNWAIEALIDWRKSPHTKGKSDT